MFLILQICIDCPSEYLTSISGTFGNYKGSVYVKSLCFGTNQKQYGLYGSDTGTRFSYDGKGGVIVGFHGLVDKCLDAVGIYVMPESLVFGPNSRCENNSMHEVCPLIFYSLFLVILVLFLVFNHLCYKPYPNQLYSICRI